MNILTFDTEEWYLEEVLHGGRPEQMALFDKILSVILDKLDEQSLKATFFCIGMLAKNYPDVVKRIAICGHDIGCHSNKHVWLTKLSREEALSDTREAIDSLEQLIGKKVTSYRAPAFTIGENNKWALEVLAECGITTDCSIYPAVHAYGGFSSFSVKEPAIVQTNGISLKEMPICTTKILGKEMAYSGGGYFRFFPYSFVKRNMLKVDYSMTYFHIGDLVPDKVALKTRKEYEEYYKQPGTFINRYKRYLLTNLGKSNAFPKLIRLLDELKFVNIPQAEELIDWGKAPIIKL